MGKKNKQKNKRKRKVAGRDASPRPEPAQETVLVPDSQALDGFLQRWGFWLLLALLGLGSFVVFRDFLSLSKLYLFKDIGSDTINGFFPQLVHNARYLREDGLLGWSFSQGMGQNIFPASMGDPFRLILYALGPEKLAYGIAYLEVLKILLCGSFFYLYVRKINGSPFAAVAGGLMVGFSGLVVLGGQWFWFSTIALYTIFLLYAFERFFLDGKWSLLPLAVFLITALQPFYLYLSVAFLVPYILFRIFSTERFNVKRFACVVLGVGLLCGLGVLLSSVFMFPHVYEMIQSPRGAGEASLRAKLMSGAVLEPASKLQNVTGLFRSFSSDLMGTGSQFRGWRNYFEAPMFYVGLPVLMLFPYAFFFAKRREKILSALFVLIWLLPIVFPYLRHAFWLFSGDYYRQFSFFAMFPLLLLTLQSLSRIEEFNLQRTLIWLLIPIVLIVLLVYPFYPPEAKRIDLSLRFLLLVFLVGYTLLIFGFQFTHLRPYAQVGFLFLLLIEVSLLSSRCVNRRPVILDEEYKSKVGYNDYTVDAIAHLKKIDPDFYRVEKNYSSGLAMHRSINDAKVQDFYGTPSYSSFNQGNYIRFLDELGVIDGAVETQTRWAPGLRGRHVLQVFASVKYQLIRKGQEIRLLPFYKPLKTFGDITIHENTEFMPLGFTYDSYIPRSAFNTMDPRKKAAALFYGAVVEDEDLAGVKDLSLYDYAGLGPGMTIANLKAMVNKHQERALKISNHSQKQIEGTLVTDKPVVLFFSIPYDRGWVVTLNGNKMDYLKTNIGFMGVPMPAGQHSVSLNYKPTYLKEGLVVTSLAFLAFIAVVMRDKRKTIPEEDTGSSGSQEYSSEDVD